ncbi:MAG TPA: hypothetical protein VGA69_11060 [Nitriliruptorales bacterium]
MPTRPGAHRAQWQRRYPPLAGALCAALIAVFVLPSALNVPQSNPTQTLEFAPIPPADDEPPPPDSGNVDRLGLGSSATVPGEALGGRGPVLAPPPPIPDGAGQRPVTKRCVGDPPRQTEDPLAPPCVAHFEGDNGGATYAGVDAEEVAVLFYVKTNPCSNVTSRGNECPPPGELFDLAQPAEDDDHVDVRALRVFQRYFNERFQTYGRFVHFYVYFERNADSRSPEGRRADAAHLLEEVGPFAVHNYSAAFQDDFLDATVSRGVINFGSQEARPAAFYTRYPRLVWSYLPSVDQQAALFAEFVCTKVVGHPVSFSGNGDHGEPRRLGLLSSGDERKPSFAAFAEVARSGIEDCGGEFVSDASYPVAAKSVDQNAAAQNQQAATANMAQFQRDGVTTIVWPQGYEMYHSRAAERIGYLPEWVLAGDLQHEGHATTGLQSQSAFDEKAWVVAATPVPQPPESDHCRGALREASPTMEPLDRDYICQFRTYYEDLRLTFTAIQVAGPQLTPASIDVGLHAIPAHRSSSPSIPACFFEVDDYTCVKDANASWWDADAQRSPTATGCWRLARGGFRFIHGTWPAGDVLTLRGADDPCNTYSGPLNR